MKAVSVPLTVTPLIPLTPSLIPSPSPQHIHALSLLAGEIVNDMTLKKIFFSTSEACTYCYNVMKTFKEDMDGQNVSKSACLLILRRLVACFKLIHAALFNSAGVMERYQFYYLGDTLISHLEMYAQDFVTFMHNFEQASVFSPTKLHIGDQKR